MWRTRPCKDSFDVATGRRLRSSSLSPSHLMSRVVRWKSSQRSSMSRSPRVFPGSWRRGSTSSVTTASNRKFDGKLVEEHADGGGGSGAGPHRLADDLDGREPLQQRSEHHLYLALGQIGAQAEVRATPAKRDVGIRPPLDVEAERPVERFVITVAGRVPQHDAITGANGLPTELDVLGGSATKTQHRAGPADDLIGGGRDE